MIALKGVFSSGDSSHSFGLKSDGTGAIIYSDGFTDPNDFNHEVDVENLTREVEEAIRNEIELHSQQNALGGSEIESIRAEVTAEKLEEVFREEINQSLEDTFFRSFYDGDEWGDACQVDKFSDIRAAS